MKLDVLAQRTALAFLAMAVAMAIVAWLTWTEPVGVIPAVLCGFCLCGVWVEVLGSRLRASQRRAALMEENLGAVQQEVSGWRRWAREHDEGCLVAKEKKPLGKERLELIARVAKVGEEDPSYWHHDFAVLGWIPGKNGLWMAVGYDTSCERWRYVRPGTNYYDESCIAKPTFVMKVGECVARPALDEEDSDACDS